MTAASKRAWVQQLGAKFLRTELQACRLLGLGRSNWRHQSKRRDDTALRRQIHAVAQARPRFGYRRILVMLKREGVRIGGERLRRLYPDEGSSLRMRPKRPRKLASNLRIVAPPPQGAHER